MQVQRLRIYRAESSRIQDVGLADISTPWMCMCPRAVMLVHKQVDVLIKHTNTTT